MLSFCNRYVLPLESTTCQCGSGVPGTLKSSDRVSMFFPSATVWVTLPVFALGPANLLLVCMSSAKALAAANRASAANDAMNLLFIVNLTFIVVLFLFSCSCLDPQRAMQK